MKNEYINSVSSMIQNKTAREQITAELESHIRDKIDYYVEIGYPYEEAEKRATDEMGNPDDTAVPLNSLHNNKKRNIIIIVICSILLFLVAKIGADLSLANVHKISNDLMSVLIFAFYSAMLCFAKRRKNKAVCVVTFSSLIIQFASQILADNYNLGIPFIKQFRHLAFAVVNICTKGFGGYFNSIFDYGYINTSAEVNTAYTVISIMIFAFLIIWSVSAFVMVFMQERMIWKRHKLSAKKYFSYVAFVIVAINLVLISVGTAFAYSTLDRKLEESKQTQTKMIEYLINTDITLSWGKQLDELNKAGYVFTEYNGDIYFEMANCNLYVCYEGSNVLKLFVNHNGEPFYQLEYSSNLVGTLLEQNIYCTQQEKTELGNYYKQTNGNEFFDNSFINKSVLACRSNIDDTDLKAIHFYFPDTKSYEMLDVIDGVVVWNSLYRNSAGQQLSFAN